MTGWIGFLVAAAVAIAWFVAIYNRLVAMRQQVRNAWHQIHVQLKRRHDLIPNLVATVRTYLAHEQGTLERVTAARTRAIAATDVRDASTAEAGLSFALGRLVAVVEAYPNLQANESVRDLMEELRSTENRIGFARQQYNDSVMHFNTAVQVFPNRLVAGRLGFAPSDFFRMDPGDEAVPEVRT